MFETFYATVAQVCFALLGLWWVVLQFKYAEFMRDDQHRRTAYSISLYFVLPGAMSLLSLLSTDVTILWRIAFMIAGALGALETLTMVVAGSEPPGTRATRLSRWLVLLIYFLIIVLAFSPDIPQTLGWNVPARLVEGILLSLLLFLGVHLAWVFFSDTSRITG
ncbi:MAG TPA: hypothetical protein VFD70_24755 [Anaerolineae bacterium]|nr:hypothetical protein [Anaerolineae bacterium]